MGRLERAEIGMHKDLAKAWGCGDSPPRIVPGVLFNQPCTRLLLLT